MEAVQSPVSSHPVATGSLLPPITLPPIVLPSLTYDETDLVHEQIVRSAEVYIIQTVVNDSAILEHQEREELVHAELTRAVTLHCLRDLDEQAAEVQRKRLADVLEK